MVSPQALIPPSRGLRISLLLLFEEFLPIKVFLVVDGTLGSNDSLLAISTRHFDI